ncbi:hypothetical protein [Streptomyces sp. NPDC091209]|uniref:hypothetical protein n=1 Tax=Streptomyces sp. NPDC091209 TaxID=3365974 RepID=UPI0037FA88C1
MPDDGLAQESGRVRINLAGAAASEEQRARVDRAARREYQVLRGINHRGRTSPQSPHTGLCAVVPL